jgi:hypothetical protein
VFDGVELLSKVRYEVFSITGRKPRFEIYVGGALEKSIPATRRWQAEQREAIQWCQQELGWKVDAGKANRAQVAPRTSQPRQVSALRIARMAMLYANILADRGRLESPEELLAIGHGYAEYMAGFGSKSFTEEMNRLRTERNEQETRWCTEAKAKVTYY